jgi:hypothetical protein
MYAAVGLRSVEIGNSNLGGSAAEVNQLLAAYLAHLQQPTSIALPALSGVKDDTKSVSSVDKWFLVGRMIARMLSDLFSGKGIVAGWPAAIRPKPPINFSPIWPLFVVPLWNFCFLVPILAIIGVLNMHTVATAESVSKVSVVLGGAFTSWCIGLTAAQFSVAVTPSRLMRPVMSLWILVPPYLLAKQVSEVVAYWYGCTFSLVPAPLSNETGSYLFIAILSALIYSIVIRREPALPVQEKTLSQSLREADSGEFN